MLNPSPHLLAFGFANAAILGWLAAAAAPILIHLWMKRVHRETPWAAVRFLQAAIKRNARRLRLQEWILLAVRTAIILLVVLAASKPVLDSLGALLGAGVRTHRVLVIDASLSMRYRLDDGGSVLDAAKRLAGDLVEQSSTGDSFSLLVMTSPPSAPIRSPTTDAASVRRAVSRIEPTDAATDLAATLSQIDGLLKSAEKAASPVDRREVVFFTDLSTGSWGGVGDMPGRAAGEGPAVADAQPLLAGLAERAKLSIIDVGIPGATNTAAADLRIISGTPTTRQPVAFQGAVERFGPKAGDGAVMVELTVDGLSVASREVSLSGGRADVEFRHQFRRPGWRRVALRLPGDALQEDDARLLAVEVKPYVNVLCVEGVRGAARYVADALNPAGEATAPIQVSTVSDTRLASIELAGYDAVVVCNVAEFSTREAGRLAKYAEAGGGVAFFLGDRVRADRYNAVLGAGGAVPELSVNRRSPFQYALLGGGPKSQPVVFQPERTTALLPVAIGDAVASSSRGVDPLDYRHPIVAPFEGRERAGLLTTPIDRYFRLRVPSKGSPADVVMAAASGDPLMVASSAGSGRVVVVATAASLTSIDPSTGRPWTAMPAWPSFVPIVREIVRYASGAAFDRESARVGQAISGPALGGVEVLRPDATTEAIPVRPAENLWRYERTDRAGYYAVAPPGQEGAARLYAVNIEASESDITRVAADDLPPELTVRGAAIEADATAPELTSPVGVHHSLLLAALALVLVETGLACWFGRGKA